MKDSTKYQISSILLITSFIIIILYKVDNKELSTNNSTQKGFIDLSPLSEVLPSTSDKILPLIILTTNICLSCLNNVVEYQNLINQNNHFFSPLIVFINEEIEVVNYYTTITNLDIDYKVLPEFNNHLFPTKRNIIFIDNSSKQILLNVVISNSTSPEEYKLSLMNEAYQIWNKK